MLKNSAESLSAGEPLNAGKEVLFGCGGWWERGFAEYFSFYPCHKLLVAGCASQGCYEQDIRLQHEGELNVFSSLVKEQNKPEIMKFILPLPSFFMCKSLCAYRAAHSIEVLGCHWTCFSLAGNFGWMKGLLEVNIGACFITPTFPHWSSTPSLRSSPHLKPLDGRLYSIIKLA